MPSVVLLPRAWHSTKKSFAESLFFTECPALSKALFAECNSLPSAALGKEGLCRVPDFLHSAKQFAFSKDSVSSSGVWITMQDYIVKPMIPCTSKLVSFKQSHQDAERCFMLTNLFPHISTFMDGVSPILMFKCNS